MYSVLYKLYNIYSDVVYILYIIYNPLLLSLDVCSNNDSYKCPLFGFFHFVISSPEIHIYEKKSWFLMGDIAQFPKCHQCTLFTSKNCLRTNWPILTIYNTHGYRRLGLAYLIPVYSFNKQSRYTKVLHYFSIYSEMDFLRIVCVNPPTNFIP